MASLTNRMGLSACPLGEHRGNGNLGGVDVRHASLAGLDQDDSHGQPDCCRRIYGNLWNVLLARRLTTTPITSYLP